eukprot:CAMPEP_0206497828 /NCGR_PEP_ID=MMETSP0324_2-20121206/50511_1 /ASSEMBLY_ACC=CAM_ASM_000836 /TAXON_ID=2866 /ORGANISM="Crypthecodinium cohnii, Strain Seligo" /LENGTH=54 /DNA_ID=CAMNT_0053983659 /DNA_START=74 /DNA_END=236 /DNA_ORIENTATION=+
MNIDVTSVLRRLLQPPYPAEASAFGPKLEYQRPSSQVKKGAAAAPFALVVVVVV